MHIGSRGRPAGRSRGSLAMDPTQLAVNLPVEGELPSLEGTTGWLNSRPLSTADLQGKVVLVDFWTYTCINWLRTLPTSAPGPRNTGTRVWW